MEIALLESLVNNIWGYVKFAKAQKNIFDAENNSGSMISL